ncbi:hypothetical protein [Phenylobacterium sp.]|uniref:hypothetical protein n=1 Tax=Phenylobacterium sp. TaxID=1871053 RepID=UPI00286DC6C6|nr:hypothetical protein [Phenylobacterium sp.]
MTVTTPIISQDNASPCAPPPDDVLQGAAVQQQEVMEVWAASYGLWRDYWLRLATATGPTAVIDAGWRLMLDSAEVYGLAAGVRLRDAGLRMPLLSDA